MQNMRSKRLRPASLLLAIVVLIAQTGALVHAYEHDPGSPQTQVCATCIAGHAVGSACVDSMPHCRIQIDKPVAVFERISTANSIDLPLARQRAPPTPR
jgi:hypothetical protein